MKNLDHDPRVQVRGPGPRDLGQDQDREDRREEVLDPLLELNKEQQKLEPNTVNRETNGI